MNFPWKYILISFLIGLFLGSAIGLTGSGALRHRWMKRGPQMFVQQLDRKVKLTDTQRGQIQSLLNDKHTRLDTFHNEVRQATRADIRKVLTSEQQPTFDAFIAKKDARRNKRGR